jgi:hypothetical protein
MNKYCRICWNTDRWRSPSGKAGLVELGDSYVARHHFGHEEWLFNFGWLLKGYDAHDHNSYRYAFLQPIGKYLAKYQGETFSVLLYTVNPDKRALVVACIRNLYVPDNQESEWALKKTIKNGWLSAMKQELASLGIDSSPFKNPAPSSVINVRFRPQDVEFFDPRPAVAGDHKITRTHRYHPLDWDDEFPPTSGKLQPIKPPMTPDDDDDPTRSEAQRTRSATDGVAYDLRHTQLQNRLYRALCAKYGPSAVRYEEGFVDLVLKRDDQIAFIEVKMELTVKRCLRLALGQLLEYAHYPNVTDADRLLVVGDVFPTSDDISYLNYLRGRYKLPVYYARWDWEKASLAAEV